MRKKIFSILLFISFLLGWLSFFAYAEDNDMGVNRVDTTTDVIIKTTQDLTNAKQPFCLASSCDPSHLYYCGIVDDYYRCCWEVTPLCCENGKYGCCPSGKPWACPSKNECYATEEETINCDGIIVHCR